MERVAPKPKNDSNGYVQVLLFSAKGVQEIRKPESLVRGVLKSMGQPLTGESVILHADAAKKLQAPRAGAATVIQDSDKSLEIWNSLNGPELKTKDSPWAPVSPRKIRQIVLAIANATFQDTKNVVTPEKLYSQVEQQREYYEKIGDNHSVAYIDQLIGIINEYAPKAIKILEQNREDINTINENMLTRIESMRKSLDDTLAHIGASVARKQGVLDVLLDTANPTKLLASFGIATVTSIGIFDYAKSAFKMLAGYLESLTSAAYKPAVSIAANVFGLAILLIGARFGLKHMLVKTTDKKDDIEERSLKEKETARDNTDDKIAQIRKETIDLRKQKREEADPLLDALGAQIVREAFDIAMDFFRNQVKWELGRFGKSDLDFENNHEQRETALNFLMQRPSSKS